MRHITEEGLALIKHFEGFRPKAYLDSAGLPTIGFGHLLKAGESYSMIDIAQATELLKMDIRSAEASVLRLISVPLQDNEFDALVSFTFNCGGGALQRSTLRKKVNREEHHEVPHEFMKWCRAGGMVIRGIALRRSAEARMYDPEFVT